MKKNIIEKLTSRVKLLEALVKEISGSVRTAKRTRKPAKTQSVNSQHMSKALCVDTMDPWKRNRVRFYHPIIHNPETQFRGLPWACPVSSMGGFDDSGLSWVPPAGATLCVVFENADIEKPYYLGTTWSNDRGPGGRDFPYPVEEYQRIYAGHRKGYLVGPNDESQERPPWDTENYNGFNLDTTKEFLTDFTAQNALTYPNIYGFKTPEKHMLKLVDGNAKCNRRWKRIELMSGCGNWMIFKDDHLHYGGQWANQKCPPDPGGTDVSLCSSGVTEIGVDGEVVGPYFTDPQGVPFEKETCQGSMSNSSIQGGHPSTPGSPPNPTTRYYKSQHGSNQYFKHANECRPYRGPGTPQNNRCALPQTGIQFLTIGGHTMVMDDSVEEPEGAPIWERSLQNFSFGCNNKCLGVFWAKSMTGHQFVMCDVEEKPGLRGEQNYIELRSASGNSIQLNDHTIGKDTSTPDVCVPCPPNYAGEKRGIHMQSTSNHVIHMCDNMNEQCGPCRMEGGVPQAKATQAYVQIQSGYGHEIMMADSNSQQVTQRQWLRIMNPQCGPAGPAVDKYCQSCGDNDCRGPHFLELQARPRGKPGVVFLRAGGHAVRTTFDMDIVMVGDKDKNPSDKFTYVSKKRIAVTEDVDYRYSGQLHIFFAEKYILLMAGRDCSPPQGKKCKGPCLYPVIVGRCPVICPVTGILHWTEKSASERVFASANSNCMAGCGGCPDTGQSPPCRDEDSHDDVDTSIEGSVSGTGVGTQVGQTGTPGIGQQPPEENQEPIEV